MKISSNNIRLSVIVCTLNPDDSISETLTSLEYQSLDTNTYEIIVVDNASVEERQNYLKELCTRVGFLYVRASQPGLSIARNVGIEVSSGEFIYFIDDDAVAPAHILSRIIEGFEENPNRAGIGGPVHGLWSESPPFWLTSRYWRMLSLLSYGDSPRALSYPEIVIGCNMAFRKSLFEEGYSFSLSLGRKGSSLVGGEERLIQQSIAQSNREIYYMPDMYVFHKVPAQRMTLDYIRARAYGAEVSRIEMEDKNSLLADIFTSLSELFLVFLIYPVHLFRFGFRSSALKITLVVAGVRARFRHRNG